MTVETEERVETPRTAVQDAADLWLTRVRLRAQRKARWMHAQFDNAPAQVTDGMVILHSEVERILEDPAEAAEAERRYYLSDPDMCRLTDQIALVDTTFRQHPACILLRHSFGLSDFEMDLLNLAMAVEIDPMLRRAYAYIHDEATSNGATQWLTSILFGHGRTEWLDSQSPLVLWQLLLPSGTPGNMWASNTSWQVEPSILSWVLGCSTVDPALGESARMQVMPEQVSHLCLYPDELQGILAFIQSMSGDMQRHSEPMAIEIELVGAEGSGKQTLATQIAASCYAGLIAIDSATLLGGDIAPEVASERILRAMRMGRLTGALLYWADSEGVPVREWQTSRRYGGLTLFGATSPSTRSGPGVIQRTFQLPPLKREQRLELWKQYCDQPPPRLITEGLLTPEQIVKAAVVAPAGMEAAIEACQESPRLSENDLFTCLPCPFTWDDIVLPSNVQEHLLEFEQQVRLRWAVYEEWGFEKLCPTGRGITALFAGVSGTGKTMAAQVVARSLGLRLFRIDLAGVVNKYIGETEKRLKQVFDACERANVLLLFDEADALFGQRTQVKDAHDRFANIEIDYLLQRMEQFDGIAVLSTNRKGDLDKAFLRRIRFMVDFQPPGPAERLTLWRRALLAHSPSGEEILDGIDWSLLANKLNMTGAGITAAALGAAFLARSEGGRIGMSHVLHAARREMNKQGLAVRPGDWER